ncbi:hypothetical protein DW761_02295 [Absiella sp. AM29-15]|nr:hypothetical protein DW761_02295 [Absiella sp. AM29-15]
MYRKWDNVKHICEKITDKKIPRKVITESGNWGLKINMKERLHSSKKDNLIFESCHHFKGNEWSKSNR